MVLVGPEDFWAGLGDLSTLHKFSRAWGRLNYGGRT